MHAAAWSSKLRSLDIHGIPLGDLLPPSIPQLTGLTSLRLHSCGLQPRAAAALVRQVGLSCKALQVLGLAGNELWQLPKEGWEGLAGLKVSSSSAAASIECCVPVMAQHINGFLMPTAVCRDRAGLINQAG
jgi:hypothetical protein